MRRVRRTNCINWFSLDSVPVCNVPADAMGFLITAELCIVTNAPYYAKPSSRLLDSIAFTLPSHFIILILGAAEHARCIQRYGCNKEPLPLVFRKRSYVDTTTMLGVRYSVDSIACNRRFSKHHGRSKMSTTNQRERRNYDTHFSLSAVCCVDAYMSV